MEQPRAAEHARATNKLGVTTDGGLASGLPQMAGRGSGNAVVTGALRNMPRTERRHMPYTQRR